MQSKRPSLLKLLVLFVVTFNIAYAENCEELIKTVLNDNSFPSILQRTKTTLAKALEEEPLPITSDISARRKQVWTGLEGPQALQPFLAKGVKFLKTPDPNTESPFLAMRKHPGTSALLHVDLPFKGQNTSTKVFVAKPVATSKSAKPDGQYLIGPEFESVVWHIHGGGTPSAVAGNASSKANYYVKRGIPVLAVDQPGHGNGPTFPFASDEEIHEWNYELMKQLIHPDVKIHLHGHSWGGMKTTRVWQNSDDKFDRIVAFQAESPGADMSLGRGGPREKAKIEKEINDSIDDWEHRAAPSDVEFTKNVVQNRKMSPVAQEYTFMTDIFYRWGHLSPEEIGRRKRINVLVGTYDGLVYVGRESVYDDYYSRIAGQNYHKFTRGKTFKGEDIEQGHQIFDLVDEQGDFVAYRIGVDLVQEMSGQDVSIRAIDGDTEDPVTMVNKIFNTYANNFAFREFLEKHVEYVETYNQKHSSLIRESNAIKAYVGNVQKLEKEYTANRSRLIEDGMREYSNKYNVNSTLEKAKAELEIDSSAERKQVLKDFIDRAKAAEDDAKKDYHDPVHELAIQQFTEQVDRQLGEGAAANIRRYEDFIEGQRNLNNLYRKISGLDETDEVFIKSSQTIEKIYDELELTADQRSLDFIANEMKRLLTPPEGNKNPKWKNIANKALQDLKKLNKDYRRRFNDAIGSVVVKMDKPEGIKRRVDAEWEYSLELTTERKNQLKGFIEGYQAEEERVRREIKEQLNANIAAVERPETVQTIEEALERMHELNEILKKRFVPEQNDPDYDQISRVVEKLKMLDKELNPKESKTTMAKLIKTDNDILRLKKERTKLVKRLNSLLEVATPSEKLQKAMDNYDKYLETLIEVNTRYAEKQEEFYLRLFEQGQLTRENIANIPEDLRAMAKEYETALSEADAAEARLSRVRLIEAREGNLVSEKDPDGSNVKGILNSLLGDYQPGAEANAFANDSIEGQLINHIKAHEVLESRVFKLKQKSYELERVYQSFFVGKDRGNMDFYQVTEISLKDLLSKDYDELIKTMQGKEGRIYRQAFKKTMGHWDDLWSRINLDDNFKKSELYNIEN